MTTEYLKKMRAFAKWLVPFALAVFLLFGCGSSGNASVSGQPSVTAAETAQAGEISQTKESAQAGEQLQAGEQSRAGAASQTETAAQAGEQISVEEDGAYSSKDEVALYIHTYGKLPENFITKKQAEKLGWVSKEGNLWDVAPGKSIGGSHFGNYEGQLPDKDGRKWYECDIDFDGSYRGAKRIIYSNDGLIYYTGDHYKTFEQLY